MTTAVLEAREIRKSYHRRKVLRGVDLSVLPGQLVAVAGENGAGKSTLLKILAGMLAADGGEVRRDGTLGYCPQDPVLDDTLTAGQHLRTSPPHAGCRTSAARWNWSASSATSATLTSRPASCPAAPGRS